MILHPTCTQYLLPPLPPTPPQLDTRDAGRLREGRRPVPEDVAGVFEDEEADGEEDEAGGEEQACGDGVLLVVGADDDGEDGEVAQEA